MPIIVQQAGPSLGTAGQGIAAAQQYRGNEQQMQLADEQGEMRRQQFQVQSQLALRGMELDEQQFEFQREQMAGQQTAMADMLTAQAIEMGLPGAEAEAYRQAAARLPRSFASDVYRAGALAMRERGDQVRLSQAMADMESTPEIKEALQPRIESGEIRTPAQLEQAVARERGKVARVQAKEAEREKAKADFDAWRGNPLFQMPPAEDEAYEDTMELLGELQFGATRDSVDYAEKLEELMVLTNPKSLAATRRMLERDLGKSGGFGEEFGRGMYGKAAQDADVQMEAEDMRRDDFAKADRAQADAAPARYGPESPPGQPTQSMAGSQGTALLKEPVPGRLAGQVPDDVMDQVQKKLREFGINDRPKPGTPEYRMVQKLVRELLSTRTQPEDAPEDPSDFSSGSMSGVGVRKRKRPSNDPTDFSSGNML